MITIKHDACIVCVGCSAVCPTQAIVYSGNRMKVIPEKCIDCGLCVKACPADVIEMHKGVKSFEELIEMQKGAKGFKEL